MIWRDQLKETAERGCVSAGLPALSRLGRRRDILILAYHNVVRGDVAIGGDCSLHMPRTLFADQLDLLQETHAIVPLSAVLNGERARGDRPRAVITFDDAYRGALTEGVREVVRRDLPATIFVAPACLGGTFFWWDLVTPAGAPEPTDSFRRRALEECRGVNDAVLRCAERCGHALQRMPDEAACATEEELRSAAEKPGITLGSHSWSHSNLRRLSRTELAEDLARSLAWLRERFDRALPVLSYPYGLCSSAVERAAATAGYQAGVTIAGGWMSHRARNPFALPRVTIPARISPAGFLLRTAGLVRT